MPHVVVLYTGGLDAQTDMTGLCRHLADALLALRDETGQAVFPVGGLRVLAYPAPHFAVADGGAAGQAHWGRSDYGFVYVNLRMAAGRSQAVQQAAGKALLAAARAQLEPLFAQQGLGLTVQVDEAPGQVFDGKHSSLHPLFTKG